MKSIIGFGLFFFLVFLENSQGQGGYLDSTYQWTERHITFAGPGPVRAYKLSSLPIEYNGKLYYNVLHTLTPENNNWQSSANYIRTDPPYIYLLKEKEEYLIYDFTLDVNDTFNLNNGINSRLIVVTEIDSFVMLNGEMRKRFTIQNCFSDKFTCYWYEGLCSSYSVVPGSPPCAADAGSELLCLSRQDTLLCQSNPLDTCSILSVSLENFTNAQISIFPNPTAKEISIDAKNNLIVKVSIIDLLGNIIFTGSEPTVDISFLRPGYYLLRIELENRHIVMKKFVKQ